MQTNLVMMPIKVLYLNQIKLGEVLKVTKLLLRLVNNLGLKFDSESYIKEMHYKCIKVGKNNLQTTFCLI